MDDICYHCHVDALPTLSLQLVSASHDRGKHGQLIFDRDLTIPGGHCTSENGYLVSIAAWGLLIDVAITILPIPMIWNLQQTTRRKIGLSIIFGLWTL